MGGVNRSVIVEPSTLKGLIRFQDLIPSSGLMGGGGDHTGKTTPIAPNIIEIETMMKEL
jgi:hypothetical protein